MDERVFTSIRQELTDIRKELRSTGNQVIYCLVAIVGLLAHLAWRSFAGG